MKIRGFGLRFACADGEQYETIGAFWDHMRAVCPGVQLSGVGYGWENGTLRYLIGTENGLPAAAEKIRSVFPEVEYTELLLPDAGWKTYTAAADTLDVLYAEVYRDGPLSYEIEQFDADGNTVVRIYRTEGI